jgi:dTDP-4-amino-4,6-dideoxygalactose transaminase
MSVDAAMDHLGLNQKDFPNAYKAYREAITLPFFPDLKTNEIDYVCRAIEDICRKFKR